MRTPSGTQVRIDPVEEQLRGIFAQSLGIDAHATDWSGLTYRGIREWDSVAHMNLVGEIEDAFDIMLDTDDVIGMNSFTTAKQILARYGLAFD